MSTTEPIRNINDLKKFKSYYECVCPDSRNSLLLTIGLNTALRIGDILALRWDDVFDFARENIRDHIRVCEQKTGKLNIIAINPTLKEKLLLFRELNPAALKNDYLFQSKKRKGQALSRYQAFRIIKEAAAHAGIEEHISCHSLRKTFGYHAWKQGVPPVMLMKIFNHSSYQITIRYLCIEQDEKDEVFQNIIL